MGLKKLSEIDNASDEIKMSDEIIGVFGGKLLKVKVSELMKNNNATTDYTKLENNPITLITTEDYSASNLEDGHTYLIARKGGTRINFGATLSYGSQIIIDGKMATVICGQGIFFIPDINDTEYWGLADYCPALSEVYEIVDESVTDAINCLNFNGKDISKAIVIFQNSDGMNTTLYLSAFAKNVMESLETKQDKITLGDGLKWDSNGKLCLDIENGDNLKYGTATTAEETNKNEVVTNE